MADNPLVNQKGRNSQLDDGSYRQEHKFSKQKKNDLHAYVQQSKQNRNREDIHQNNDDYSQEDEEDNQGERFGGFTFNNKGKNEPKKQQAIYEPKNKQQQQKKEYQQKQYPQNKKKQEKKNTKPQQEKEPSKQQLTELAKLQQHLLNCGIISDTNQDYEESELIIPQEQIKVNQKQVVAPPPGLGEDNKSNDFADLLNQFHDDDSDGQMNFDQHFQSQVITRSEFITPIGNLNQEQKQKEKKKKNKKKKPNNNNKNKQDLALINNPPDFMNPQSGNDFYDPFNATPFSFPQNPINKGMKDQQFPISGPNLTLPLGIPPQGLMNLGPQINMFPQNLMGQGQPTLGAPPNLGYPEGPTLGMDNPQFSLGPNIGPLGMIPSNFNLLPKGMGPTQQKQRKQQQNKQMPSQFDNPVFFPPQMLGNPLGNQFQDFQQPILQQPFAQNLMPGPMLGMQMMPPPFDNNFNQDWNMGNEMIQLPPQIGNPNFPNLSQTQHPSEYPSTYYSLNDWQNERNEQQLLNQENKDEKPKQRKKLNLNSKPFQPTVV